MQSEVNSLALQILCGESYYFISSLSVGQEALYLDTSFNIVNLLGDYVPQSKGKTLFLVRIPSASA